jgi:hypothetical protein
MIKTDRGNARRWLLLVLAAAVLARLALWMVYPLTPNNDSPTYVQLARSIVNKGFSEYNATRSPGYPAFLALTGGWTYPVQLALGLATTLLIYFIAARLSGRAWFGALAGLLHTLNLGQLFFEATLLTETLTTFLVAAALAAVINISSSGQEREKRSFFGLLLGAFLAGLAASLAGMVRPLFAYLPVLISVFFLGLAPFALRKRGALSIAALLPAIFIFGWWLNYVNINFKILSFDTIGGFRWLNHTGEYFEYVPDKYAVIRDTYIKYRNAKITETGSQTNAVWDAMDELQKKSRLGFYALSRTLTSISLSLIQAHPDRYLKNVFGGWWMFWWAAVYWSSESFVVKAFIPVVNGLILLERGVMILSNFLFIGGSLAIVFWKRARAQLGMSPFLWLALAVVWGASVVQTLMDHGDNPRYLVPLQSMVMFLVAWWLCQIFYLWKANKR